MGVKGAEEGIEIFHAFDDEDGGTLDDAGPDLRKAADVVEGTTDDEDKVVGKALTSNQILCIGDEGAMADHHSFRLTRSTRGIEDVCDAVGNVRCLEAGFDFPKKGLWHSLLQGCGHTTRKMGGEIGNEEGCILGGTEAMDGVIVIQRHTELADFLPQLSVSKSVTSTDYGNLGGIALGILMQIIFEGHEYMERGKWKEVSRL